LSVSEQQQKFASALMRREEAVPAMVAGPGGDVPTKRFDVYRNNVFASLTRCLASRFPVVARLVGEEFFLAMAGVFVERHAPTSAALFEYGEEFADFLRTFEPVQGLPFLADVARLEWLVAAAYHAADAQVADTTVLSKLGDAAPEARLLLHPSVALHLSPYPIFEIWQTNTRDSIVRPIDASSGGEAVLIVRPRFDVTVIRLETAAYAFVRALASGNDLALAAEIATELDCQFDVGAAIQTLFTCGAIVGARRAFNSQSAQPQSMRMLSCAT
jgi:hypothetical protein